MRKGVALVLLTVLVAVVVRRLATADTGGSYDPSSGADPTASGANSSL